MLGTLYIINTHEDWWQLRTSLDHIVLACGEGKDNILRKTHDIVVRYKNESRLGGAIYDGAETRKMPAAEVLRRRDEYTKVGKLHEKELNEVILAALKEVHDNSPIKKVQSKVKVIKKVEETPPPKPLVVHKKETPVEVTTPVKKVQPLKGMKKIGLK